MHARAHTHRAHTQYASEYMQNTQPAWCNLSPGSAAAGSRRAGACKWLAPGVPSTRPALRPCSATIAVCHAANFHRRSLLQARGHGMRTGGKGWVIGRGARARVAAHTTERTQEPAASHLDGKSPSLSATRPGDVVGAHARRHCVTTTQNDALRLAESPRAYNVRGRARRSDLVDFACQSARSAPSRSLTERRRSVGAT